MSTGAIIGIIIAVIVVVAVIVVASAGMRRARLRRQFGPEYDRLVQQRGSRRKAEAELAERERRVKALQIRELSPGQQASYSGDWTAVQERFVDTPAEAVGAANTLIWAVMRDRGYPADDRATSMDALSVYHSRPLEGYRQTLDLRPESASTEQLRETMIRYRALFEDLTGLRDVHSDAGRDRVAEIRDRAAGGHAVTGDGTRADETAAAEDRDLAARDRDLTADRDLSTDRDLDAGGRERAARDRELAAENPNRTADTPR